MLAWTRARVAGATYWKSLTTLETVRTETPAWAATSCRRTMPDSSPSSRSSCSLSLASWHATLQTTRTHGEGDHDDDYVPGRHGHRRPGQARHHLRRRHRRCPRRLLDRVGRPAP